MKMECHNEEKRQEQKEKEGKIRHQSSSDGERKTLTRNTGSGVHHNSAIAALKISLWCKFDWLNGICLPSSV